MKKEREEIQKIKLSKTSKLYFIIFVISEVIVFKILEKYAVRNPYLVIVSLFLTIVFFLLYLLLVNYLNKYPGNCGICGEKIKKIGEKKGYSVFKCPNLHVTKMKTLNPAFIHGGL